MEKTTYTKADCLTVDKAAKKFNVDKDKLARVVSRLYISNKKIPGKPLKHVILGGKGAYRISGDPAAVQVVLEEYNNTASR